MSSISDLKKLDDEQVKAFDTEYVNDARWEMVRQCIDRDFPGGNFKFLDIGGGNGVFADRILEHYSDSSGIVIDNSRVLVDLNSPNERKRVICDSLENLSLYPECESVDIVFINWVLHHMVSPTYKQSLNNIIDVLNDAKSRLSDTGRISIFENMYDGWYFKDLSSRLIFEMTSSQTLAPVMRRLGANTAGCGVCMLSKPLWDRVLDISGIEVMQYTADSPWRVSLPKRLVLHLGSIRVGHFWGR